MAVPRTIVVWMLLTLPESRTGNDTPRLKSEFQRIAGAAMPPRRQPECRRVSGCAYSPGVIEVDERDGQSVITSEVDGNFDHTRLPDRVIIDQHITTEGGEIVSLVCRLAGVERPA